jgi:hypothetical protein
VFVGWKREKSQSTKISNSISSNSGMTAAVADTPA